MKICKQPPSIEPGTSASWNPSYTTTLPGWPTKSPQNLIIKRDITLLIELPQTSNKS